MLLKEPFAFVVDFVDAVNQQIEIAIPGKRLSKTKRYWLGFCISAIMITNGVCWAWFERVSLGHSRLLFLGLISSINVLLTKYGISKDITCAR